MIYESEILKGQVCPEEYEDNLLELLIRMNKVRDAWGRPMQVTSGYRSEKKQRGIYADRGYVPMGSKHLCCQACDIYDPDKKLQTWIKENVKLMEEIGLWFEDFDATPTWVHCQTVPPRSKARFFKP